MHKNDYLRTGVFASILLCLLLVGCGPSADEQAATSVALTATAATDTPTPTLTPTPTDTPTPTATPVPYDLGVIVTGEEDAPIVGAHVVLEEVSDETRPQITDDVGQALWYELPGETVSLSISAQGYFPLDLTDSIERGINQIIVALERDPHGMLPSEACMPGERLLYIEDFQDGEAQGWMEIEYRAQEWDIVSNPDNPGDFVVTRPTTYEGYANLQDRSFDNAVWRFKLMHTGKSVSNFSWHWHDTAYETEAGRVEWSAYPVWIHFPDIHVNRRQSPISEFALRWTSYVLRAGVWHQIEISTYEGRFEFWVDGVPWVRYDDPEPLPEGRIVIGVGLQQSPDNTENVYFDDMSVCQLDSPVTPLPTPES